MSANEAMTGTEWVDDQLLIDNGWLGELIVKPGDTLMAEGTNWPVVTWRMTPAALDRVTRGLSVLDEIGESMRANSETSPAGNRLIVEALSAAADELVVTGRVEAFDDPETGWTFHDQLPRRCRVCGCTDTDCSQCIERTGQPCSWVEPDLCSASASSAVTIGAR